MSSCSNGKYISFISNIPRFFWSMCEPSTTMRFKSFVFSDPALISQCFLNFNTVKNSLPASKRSMMRWGVPTPMLVRARSRNCLASSILICFANSLATVASLLCNGRSALKLVRFYQVFMKTINLPDKICCSKACCRDHKRMRTALFFRCHTYVGAFAAVTRLQILGQFCQGSWLLERRRIQKRLY